MPFDKAPHTHVRTLTAQDQEDPHQQHPPLRETDAPAQPAVRMWLEVAGQITCCNRRGGGIGIQGGGGAAPAKASEEATAKQALPEQPSDRPFWACPLRRFLTNQESICDGT